MMKTKKISFLKFLNLRKKNGIFIMEKKTTLVTVMTTTLF